MPPSRPPRHPVWLALSLAVLAGCSGGPKNGYPVRGKVTHNGTAAAGALVVFHPRGATGPDVVRPSAVTAEDGTFSLSIPGGTGAPAGEYDVTVVCEKPAAAKGDKAGEREVSDDVFRGRFANPAGSGLRATVKAGDNDLPPFDLR
jgi:hypothetical protein